MAKSKNGWERSVRVAVQVTGWLNTVVELYCVRSTGIHTQLTLCIQFQFFLMAQAKVYPASTPGSLKFVNERIYIINVSTL
jgi:hypothetical protein